ncbi:glycosyl transferase family 2 [Beutenbergia cavernae DSM 12333]|uniref:Glycosyl transferase family 2 n=1 Tax=Beutenbergia cavernae (strain ATCC BAA-8 / DSM 12333 / CCUG 43141 / JCM 11478 / NBRC 16432 / NCIMB 13614 / HKI 0122) TaxID=471853 RepID=C5C068_BEUC1|nr:glycosyltransferase family 2 protein [Beutenbergia cavernae]ACQ79254.1 glycosyl transferase family 2 [Beutenbergia cavernae DSM 12333]
MVENTTPPSAVVVVSFGSSALLEANLGPLEAAAGRPDVVVVDNFSGAAERATITRLAAERGWELVAPERNLGFGDGVNLGAERAFARGAEVVCVLNPDARLSADGFDRLVRAAHDAPRALVAPRMVDGEGRVSFEGAEVRLHDGTTTRADVTTARHPWLSGACLAFGREAWDLVGGFSSEYFLYWEDVDLSWRMREAGGELRFLGDVTAVHDVGGTQNRSRWSTRSTTYVYFNCRNRLVFAAHHLEPRAGRTWLRRSPRYARDVLLRGGSRLALLSPRAVWAAVSGTLSGAQVLVRGARHA